MKIQTRQQLTELIAKRIYEDREIFDLSYGNCDTDWGQAEGVVSFFLDEAGNEPLWARQKDTEDHDYDKFRHFIRNYEDNALDMSGRLK